jgi:hypothetical protein
MNTCRICKESQPELWKYGVSHYAHLRCALEKWGAPFLDKLRPGELEHLPVMTLREFGLVGEVKRRHQDYLRRQKAREAARS